MVSATVANQNLKATAIMGRIVNVGRLGGGRGEFDFDTHAGRRINYIGVTHRTRSMAELREEVRRWREDLWDAVIAGTLHLPIDRTYRLDEAEEAQKHMRTNS